MSNMQKIEAGTAQIIPQEELKKALDGKKKLTVKLGVDPTAPDLHLGHAVVLKKLKEFQDLGHNVVFLIGDFTARIGDPTGRSKTRPPLTQQEIARNTKTYLDQAGLILDIDKAEIRYNSEWLDELTAQQLVTLCSQATVAQIIEREDFAKRLKEHQPISFHELLYPLLQAYDSVALQSDVELGGTDQTFNLLMGRHIQQQYDIHPQIIITMPLLIGLDGTHKMSKSYGNTIGLTEGADQVFGKLMSLSDELMWHYYQVLLNKSDDEIKVMQDKVAAGTAHPMQLKKEMAHAVLAKFWGPKQADEGQQAFEEIFEKREYDKAQEVIISKSDNPIGIIDLLKHLGAVQTNSEARRLIEAGAVKIDGATVTDRYAQIAWKAGTLVKVGKHRIYRLAQ